jgi:hypothetical protein
VRCPGCGATATDEANQILAQKLAPPRRSRFAAGLSGAVLAAAVAGAAWFFLIRATGWQIGFAAWGAGLFVGLGARCLGGAGGRALGAAAAVCAVAAVLGGQAAATGSDGFEFAADLEELFRGGAFGWATPVWLLLAGASAFKLAAPRVRA